MAECGKECTLSQHLRPQRRHQLQDVSAREQEGEFSQQSEISRTLERFATPGRAALWFASDGPDTNHSASAAVNSRPAEIVNQLETGLVDTGVGSNWSVVVPSPSSPFALAPARTRSCLGKRRRYMHEDTSGIVEGSRRGGDSPQQYACLSVASPHVWV